MILLIVPFCSLIRLRKARKIRIKTIRIIRIRTRRRRSRQRITRDNNIDVLYSKMSDKSLKSLNDIEIDFNIDININNV
jgi:translation initiation factor 1 (eIF-1/SUI1)